MEVGGKFSVLAIFGYADDVDEILVKAARRDPIDRTFDPHESKFWIRWEWRTKKAADAARARMWELKATGAIPRWVWIGKVKKDEFVGG